MGKGKIGFRNSVADFEALKKDISEQRFAPMYLLMGEEGYFIDQLSDLLSEKILNESERAFNQIVVYGRDSEYGTIINACRQMPMMGNVQVVIVKEAQQLRQIDQLSLYTQAPSQSTILVLCHKEKNVDKRLAFYKHIQQKGRVFESVQPRDYEIGDWLTRFIRSRGKEIEPVALGMLTEHLGTELSKISNELDKLTVSLPENTKLITADHIEQNIGISKEFNNFELTRAMSERNIERALTIANHFSQNPAEHPLFLIISTLFSHFQRIFIVNYLKWLAKRSGVMMPSDIDLSRMLKLPSPFFLREYKQAANLYPNQKVFLILGTLREYDLKSKGVNDGGAEQEDLLRELLLKIFMA